MHVSRQYSGITILIDADDAAMVDEYSWTARDVDNGCYRPLLMIKGYKNKEWILLHNLIMGRPGTDKLVIDHINRDRRDNRKSNLRWATRGQNQANVIPKKGRKYKGVYRYGNRTKWTSKIQYNNKSIYLGWFDTQEEAALAYNDAAVKYFGEFALLNKLPKV